MAIFPFVDVKSTRAASVEERLDQVNRMAEKSRGDALEKEARKEGELVWYAAMANDRAGELIKAFEGKYPFVKVRFQPGGAGRQLEQLLVEHRTKSRAPISSITRRSYVGVMAKAGAVARYRTPLLSVAARRLYRQGGLYQRHLRSAASVSFQHPHGCARRKAPQSFEDLTRSALER